MQPEVVLQLVFEFGALELELESWIVGVGLSYHRPEAQHRREGGGGCGGPGGGEQIVHPVQPSQLDCNSLNTADTQLTHYTTANTLRRTSR